MTRDPAMLIWLDNRSNAKAHPNENYAREVMELFALGLGAYTEDDVKEAARAFTGWTVDKSQQAVFVPARHDDGLKTVLGNNGASGADDGEHPSLTELDHGNLAFATDFRSVYATVIQRWLGRNPSEIIGGSYPMLGFV